MALLDWRQLDLIESPGRGVQKERRQERAEYAEGSPRPGGVELMPHSARNQKDFVLVLIGHMRITSGA